MFFQDFSSAHSSVSVLLSLYIFIIPLSHGMVPYLPPFFFLCNYHGLSQDYGLDDGEVVLSVQIEGDPTAYVPGNFYQISISSSETFDSFLMTGLYTTTSDMLSTSGTGYGGAVSTGGQNLMCSIVHSQVSPRPMKTLNFVWMAPSSGTGCVHFLATATHGQQLLFKDTTVLQLCEQGAANATQLRPELTQVNSDSVLMRDDFETDSGFDPSVWSSTDGGHVGDDCGSVSYGKSAIFCDSIGSRELVTVPLNLTSAHVLQFTVGGGKCRPHSELDQDIVIAYGLNSCTKWETIEAFRAPRQKTPEVHIVTLPVASRKENVCLKFFQVSNTNKITFRSPPPTKPTTPATTSTRAPAKEFFAVHTKPWEKPTKSWEKPTKPWEKPTKPWEKSTKPWEKHTKPWERPTTTTTAAAETTTTTTATISKPTKTTFYTERTTEDKKTTNEYTDTTSYFIFQPDVKPNDQPQSDQAIAEIAFHGCWAIDNVVVVNTAHPPSTLKEDFDPVDPSNWIFFPGAHVEHKCQSNGNAFVFDERNQSATFAVSRDLDLDVSDIQTDAVFFDDFERKPRNLKVIGGHTGSECGPVHEGDALIFSGEQKKRLMCTEQFDLKDVASVRFYFKFGGPGCDATVKSPQVSMYLEDDNGQTLGLRNLDADMYMTSQLVSYPVVNSTTSSKIYGQVRLCLLQKSHDGKGKDVWAIDSLALLPLLPTKSKKNSNKVLQANINLECGPGVQGKTSVGFEYSTDHGTTWHDLYTSCTPSTCDGQYQSLSSVFTSKDIVGWHRVTLPIPYVAQSPFVRFRSVHHGPVAAPWALDDVFIGSCDQWCSGHGSCVDDGCSCDFGYEGDQCEQPIIPPTSSFHETFEDPAVISSSVMMDVDGGQVGYDCGLVSSGKALVFNRAGPRILNTADMNTTEIKSIQFTLRIGSSSVTSHCPPPDAPWENVLLESSCNGGISWNLLGEFSTVHFRQPRSTSISLPTTSRGAVCQFRWRQPQHSGYGRDVWAIDDIHLSSDGAANLLSVEMMDMPDFDNRLTANLGKLVDSFCGRMRSVTFSGKEKNGEPRSLLSKDMQVGPGYIAQFDLVMGCGVPYTEGLDNDVYFQYSVDHGITWHLVEDPCLPPDICEEYRPGTVYHHSEFEDWVTVTLILSTDTWSQQTKFRWMQPEWSDTDVWGINRLYIGHPCPSLCNGHGTCHDGVCRCKKGFSGETCTPDYQADSSVQADFGHRYNPHDDFVIKGGEVARANEGCGVILSGESMYFGKDGTRELLTKDLDTKTADFIQFYIQIGGDKDRCKGADKREESVLLRYSTNGGISWNLLQELHHLDHRRPTFVHLELPKAAKSPNTRFQWWQPSHSGAGTDQWAVDEVLIGRYKHFKTIHDDFDDSLDPMQSDQWRLITEGAVGKFCGSENPSLVMSNQVNDKYVVTNDVQLKPGDVIQFEINVDCGKLFRWDYPVIFQYSHDHGQSWNLVEEPCYLDQDCDGKLTEGSIYYTGTHGQWTLELIPVTEKIAMHLAIFRWWQPGGVSHSFSIDNVYMGPPCPDNCHKRGVCDEGQCKCLDSVVDVVGDKCQFVNTPPEGMLDRFDNRNMPNMLYWDRILGGHLGRACGVVDYDNALYFGGDGTREAMTFPLNTTKKKILEFTVKIGDDRNLEKCRQPRDRNEGVVVDFSTDNGITWQVLKVVEPSFEDISSSTIVIDLPDKAKQDRTIFRFWQPLGIGGMPRAEWAIDSVLVGVNETSPYGFEDNFGGMMPDPHNWFLADSAVQRETCSSQDNALEFSNKNGHQVAETWDYHVTPSTFLQFDLAMNCGSVPGDLYKIQLEYSNDHGQTWTSVVNECAPPNFECSGYHLSSNYLSNQFSNWTRITVALPEGAVSESTRFRWLHPNPEHGNHIWALDNVYLGDDCLWLCSGHGMCQRGKCLCDPGFGGEYCVPHDPLPMMLRDDFNTEKTDQSVWGEVFGGSNSHMCGPVVSGRSFTFNKDGLRLAVTRDMDTTMLTSMEFFFKYGCGSEAPFWPRHQSVLLQYSTNGGITWKLLKEIHFSNTSAPKFYTLSLPEAAKHNATRFRFWQVANEGEMHSVWSVDNLFIGTMVMNPGSMFDAFDLDHPDPLAWTFVNDGAVDEYCSRQKRPYMFESGNSALVFRREEGGELSAISGDLEIGPMSVMQFDINIGCGAEATSKYPVRLEYSYDGGSSWSLVGADCAEDSPAPCFESKLPKTVYYAGDSVYWRRVIVPLDHLHICGTLRFRWYQGKIPDNDFGPEWALDNVYIGMACPDHCNGHGYCLGGIICQCDEGYTGETCVVEKPHSTYLKDDFNTRDFILRPKTDILLPSSLSDTRPRVDEDNWEFWSGGHVSDWHHCGKIFTEESFIQDKEGERTLTTVPLDLSHANTVQFYLKLGCNGTVNKLASPVFLQYSTNGGITWTTMEQFDFSPKKNKTTYIAVHIPLGAHTNSTQLRWWQPSREGKYLEDWAIDQIYIGGNMNGEVMLQDDPGTPLNTTWLEHPGARMEHVCGSEGVALHFKEKELERYASTADVMVAEGSVLHFELSMGCDQAKVLDQPCFDLSLEYSLDKGKTWHLLRPACLPSMAGCGHYHPSSTFRSDAFIGWHRVTVPIPKHAWSSQTRFRLYQAPGFFPDQTWAVQHLYVGSACPNRCLGQGRCMENQCVCDEHRSGRDCSVVEETLPNIVVEDFVDTYDDHFWDKVIGGVIAQPCRLLSAGKALHFSGPCTRVLETKPLNLTAAMLIQFNFLYGCINNPSHRDQGVLLEYSTNGGITWRQLTEMHYNLYRTPTFVSLRIPRIAQTEMTLLRWWQPEHGRNQDADWLIDGVRVNGDEINPEHVSVNFTEGFEYLNLTTADNMEVGEYCGKQGVAIGRTRPYEPSTLSSREVKVTDNHVLQFSINVGCEKPWDVSTQPVNVEYSTDHGMTWTDLVTVCLSDMSCQPHNKIASAHYHGVHDNWRRITLPLHGLPISNGTRFRWQQLPDGMPDSQDWALGDIYIGPSCNDNCNGHGFCFMEKCVCDEGYGGETCTLESDDTIQNQLKDTFDTVNQLNETKWPWAQGGNVQLPCETLVEGPALVFSGPGAREVVTSSLDLRDARFVQYTAFMWSRDGQHSSCSQPANHKVQSVLLQFSTDGGISWHTLHTLSPSRYWPHKHDYISLPLAARTNSSIIRWVQADAPPMTSPRVHWALDDVYIGGWEINPSEYHQSFDDKPFVNDDPTAWEFSPNGIVEGEGGECFSDGLSGAAMMWPDAGLKKDGSQQMQKFTTNQIIVQPGYMLQFKMIIGCGKYVDICAAPESAIKLEYRRNPSTELWEPVQPSCLPGSQNGGMCNPHQHHRASYFHLSQFLVWTRVTIPLSEVTFSGSTQFRWLQDGKNGSISWALDDIYIGEKCEDMCNGRGDCIQGVCHCDVGYFGASCLPSPSKLLTRLFDSFEGGIFTSHWQTVSGGGIGFGCGALLPYAHGKTLYFNGCGERQAITAEMDSSHAIKIIFVIQIGCYDQTDYCNVRIGEGPNYRGVLLQYSKNKGADWFLIAQHDPTDFLKPKRVAYDVPLAAKGAGTQFRWWQPIHDGHGFDQWAIDHVEIISGRRHYRRRG